MLILKGHHLQEWRFQNRENKKPENAANRIQDSSVKEKKGEPGSVFITKLPYAAKVNDTPDAIILGHLNSFVCHQLKLFYGSQHNHMFPCEERKKGNILNVVLTLLPWELKYILVTLAFPACRKQTNCCGLVHSNIRTLPSCAPVRSEIKR